jgi:hypothetical protein
MKPAAVASGFERDECETPDSNANTIEAATASSRRQNPNLLNNVMADQR